MVSTDQEDLRGVESELDNRTKADCEMKTTGKVRLRVHHVRMKKRGMKECGNRTF